MVVIFWLESMIVFFYTVVRLSLVSSESVAMRIARATANSIFLILVWIWLGTQLSSDILRDPAGSGAGSSGNVLRLLQFSLARNGWAAIFALFVIHGGEVIFRRTRNKEYREASANAVGIDMWKRILPLYFVPLFGGAPYALGNHFAPRSRRW